jgi:oxygen-independent coproporphyrinogen-3 oxidase
MLFSEVPSYIYSYPSKRAYRQPLNSLTFRRIWEDVSSPRLNVYLHVPFCNYRCTFCTLFVTKKQDSDLRQEYVRSVTAQIRAVAPFISASVIDSLYIGGGTPTVLEPRHFEQIVQEIAAHLPPLAPDAEFSVEGSPDTFTQPIVTALESLGVTRVSMGVQTTVPGELKQIGRPYAPEVALAAMDRLAAASFESVNFDLIYGLNGQTRSTFAAVLQSVIDRGPGTLTLYPIVARPVTPIFKAQATGKAPLAPQSHLYDLYDDSFEILTGQGFSQESMVRFTKLPRGRGYWQEFRDFAGDPVLGLGVGARGYAERVHYATRFPVAAGKADAAIRDFVSSDHDPDKSPDLAYVLSADEQFRRYVILGLSLGQVDLRAARERFGPLPEGLAEGIERLAAEGYAEARPDGHVVLTAAGFKYSSAALSTLKAPRVVEHERAYEQA